MKYAEVAVNSPFSGRRSYCYSVPPSFNVRVGQPVWVPFGSKILQGIIVELSDYPSYQQVREISSTISINPLLTDYQVQLARWISNYYLAPLFDCIALMLPPGFERKINTFFTVLPDNVDFTALDTDEREFVKVVRNEEKVSLKKLEKLFGKKKADKISKRLVQKRVFLKVEELSTARVKQKFVSYIKLKVDVNQLEKTISEMKEVKSGKQLRILGYLVSHGEPLRLSEAKKKVGFTAKTLEVLIGKGLIDIMKVQVRRDPLVRYNIVPVQAPELTPSQEGVWKIIEQELENSLKTKKSSVFLLQGVTGSGKTEIYLRALAKTISQGKKGICLVSEIALTPQMIGRFAARFPNRIAVLHSELSIGEQFDEWQRIMNGESDIVIGPRSALFSPLPSLGLIVIDEEHEWTYKQTDKSPRYHARTVAIKLAELCGANVILGSATPDVESYYRAQKGDYKLLSLRERITVRGISPMPEVEVVDLREELKSGNKSIFSKALLKALTEVLGNNEQAILFLNRRGAANFARCLNCGSILKCPRCLIALSYHSTGNRMMCHRCRYSILLPVVCPQCLKHRLQLFGIGTQKVEEEIGKIFPGARVIRWDKDVTGRRGAHEQIMKKLVGHEVDILIGTQMIAKGLDLPQVTLAGIINADTGLNIPDFRAGERTFQLACQIAGRAGRGLSAGKVIIQTYSPENYAIKAAAKHDYEQFFRQEIDFRRQLGYPPFSQFAELSFSHVNSNACLQDARKILELLILERDKRGIAGLRFIGPMPAFVPKIRGRFRWQIIVCGYNLPEFLNEISFPKNCTIDIDPVSVV